MASVRTYHAGSPEPSAPTRGRPPPPSLILQGTLPAAHPPRGTNTSRPSGGAAGMSRMGGAGSMPGGQASSYADVDASTLLMWEATGLAREQIALVRRTNSPWVHGTLRRRSHAASTPTMHPSAAPFPRSVPLSEAIGIPAPRASSARRRGPSTTDGMGPTHTRPRAQDGIWADALSPFQPTGPKGIRQASVPPPGARYAKTPAQLSFIGAPMILLECQTKTGAGSRSRTGAHLHQRYHQLTHPRHLRRAPGLHLPAGAAGVAGLQLPPTAGPMPAISAIPSAELMEWICDRTPRRASAPSVGAGVRAAGADGGGLAGGSKAEAVAEAAPRYRRRPLSAFRVPGGSEQDCRGVGGRGRGGGNAAVELGIRASSAKTQQEVSFVLGQLPGVEYGTTKGAASHGRSAGVERHPSARAASAGLAIRPAEIVPDRDRAMSRTSRKTTADPEVGSPTFDDDEAWVRPSYTYKAAGSVVSTYESRDAEKSPSESTSSSDSDTDDGGCGTDDNIARSPPLHPRRRSTSAASIRQETVTSQCDSVTSAPATMTTAATASAATPADADVSQRPARSHTVRIKEAPTPGCTAAASFRPARGARRHLRGSSSSTSTPLPPSSSARMLTFAPFAEEDLQARRARAEEDPSTSTAMMMLFGSTFGAGPGSGQAVAKRMMRVYVPSSAAKRRIRRARVMRRMVDVAAAIAAHVEDGGGDRRGGRAGRKEGGKGERDWGRNGWRVPYVQCAERGLAATYSICHHPHWLSTHIQVSSLYSPARS
ncbi:hypothetical protein BDK51DRAFT_47198 [Blyttiomyces helicus]|uniref:Uncharacterized protein n=1 Tax=Blyttiomyces helicus TaxID=388810 RepID=A0A4P9W1T1_9FUNG|nr:hypothetical protein BDK51DRAFT_47198 [Blyttiomyces helicus]|eukprot:RKO86149.1 hypothetical protein BDK51DRAFT_47198 [Blyttiomyces helicus]